ncbi:unnamed protein product [Dovyalis caffra]|uniref:Defensin-like protein n=1 Tax=Dovyalis caffra TaxID=77055 RepID=A0AAV1S5H2_9ROSI|nr:unnamed protein product [Dovyalis caffra]
MAKSFHSVLLLFASVAIMELEAEAGVCTRDMGACSPSCNDICASKYPKGGKGACQGAKCAQKGPLSQAFCDARLSPIVVTCQCSYDCS